MAQYNVAISGWGEYEIYNVQATSESDAINKAMAQTDCPWASVIEVERTN